MKRVAKENPGRSDKGASFMAADKVMLTVQYPFMDMDSGKIVHETLISIVKNR